MTRYLARMVDALSGVAVANCCSVASDDMIEPSDLADVFTGAVATARMGGLELTARIGPASARR